MNSRETGTRVAWILAVALAALVAVIGPVGLATAQEGEEEGGWTIRFEPMFQSVYGHDQHVLNVHETHYSQQLPNTLVTGVTLETDPGTSAAGGLQYAKGNWAWGVDFWVLYTTQSAPDQSHSASGVRGDEVTYEIADRQYSSSDPSDRLYFRTRGDTALQVWNANLYGQRFLSGSEQSALHLQFGLKNADFDNDYRSVVGIEGVGGTKVDASSNYSRMMGPMAGLVGELDWDKSRFEVYFAQSIVFGEVELTNEYYDFTGEFMGEDVDSDFYNYEKFIQIRDVAFPITEFRLKYSHDVTKMIGVGLGANTSMWWDVPVPPGVQPTDDGHQTLHENTVMFFGLLASVQFRF